MEPVTFLKFSSINALRKAPMEFHFRFVSFRIFIFRVAEAPSWHKSCQSGCGHGFVLPTIGVLYRFIPLESCCRFSE
jgi:hypothetical protein